MNKADKTGFNVLDDVNVVFIQTNDNKTTTTWETGSKKLEDSVGDLNVKDDLYWYEVSAILEGSRAKVVVLRDLNGTGTSGTTPSGKVGGAKVTIKGTDATTDAQSLAIGYMSAKDEPQNVNDIEAIVQAWVKDKTNWTLGEREVASGGYKWAYYDK